MPLALGGTGLLGTGAPLAPATGGGCVPAGVDAVPEGLTGGLGAPGLAVAGPGLPVVVVVGGVPGLVVGADLREEGATLVVPLPAAGGGAAFPGADVGLAGGAPLPVCCCVGEVLGGLLFPVAGRV